jgi:hypothetical protein
VTATAPELADACAVDAVAAAPATATVPAAALTCAVADVAPVPVIPDRNVHGASMRVPLAPTA